MVYWNNQTSISFKNEPVEFTLRTNIENPIVKKDDYHIPIINNIDNYNLWKGKTYPKKNGWHNLNVKQDSTTLFHFYVNDTAHWKSLRSYNTIISNQRQFMNSNLAIESFKSKKVMNLFWLYIVFIVSVGYLWLEPKL